MILGLLAAHTYFCLGTKFLPLIRFLSYAFIVRLFFTTFTCLCTFALILYFYFEQFHTHCLTRTLMCDTGRRACVRVCLRARARTQA